MIARSPRSSSVALLLALALGAISVAPAQAQATADEDTSGTPAIDQPVSVSPRWVRDLRRAEIVATGTLPLTLLASRLAYGVIRFGARTLEAGAIDLAYAPGFLAPPGAAELVTTEKVGIIVNAVVLSALIAVLDFQRGLSERRQ